MTISKRSAAMPRRMVIFLGIVFVGVTAGCSHTLSGAQQDASTDAQKATVDADKAAASTKAEVKKVIGVPLDISSATIVTPEVKTAIIRDPVLNNSANVINVTSADKVTHLIGHVATADMKQRATEDAEVVLKKRHPDYRLKNELKVTNATT